MKALLRNTRRLVGVVIGLGMLAASALPASAQHSGGDLVPIQVSVLPQINSLPMHIGLEKGFFASRGLAPEFIEVPQTSASASAVVSGSVQFGVVDIVTGASAQERGLPIRWVANLFSSPSDISEPFAATFATVESGIRSFADLNGKQVRVCCRNSMQHLSLQNAIDLHGGDSSTVEFMIMNEADAVAAIEQGHLAASALSVGGLAHAERLGLVLLGEPTHDIGTNIPITPFVVNPTWGDANPGLVQAFIDAVNESLDYAQANPEEARALLQTYYPLQVRGVEDLSTYPIPNWESCISMDSVQALVDVSERYGLLSGPMDAETLFYQHDAVTIKMCP